MSGNVTRHDIITKRNAVSINEAAEYLGVSHKTIRRMISRGDLAAYRVGGIHRGPIRILAADVEAAKTPLRAS